MIYKLERIYEAEVDKNFALILNKLLCYRCGFDRFKRHHCKIICGNCLYPIHCCEDQC